MEFGDKYSELNNEISKLKIHCENATNQLNNAVEKLRVLRNINENIKEKQLVISKLKDIEDEIDEDLQNKFNLKSTQYEEQIKHNEIEIEKEVEIREQSSNLLYKFEKQLDSHLMFRDNFIKSNHIVRDIVKRIKDKIGEREKEIEDNAEENLTHFIIGLKRMKSVRRDRYSKDIFSDIIANILSYSSVWQLADVIY